VTSTEEAEGSRAENQRILAEYRRREREVPPSLYALWQPAVLFARTGRNRLAARLLARAGVFPRAGDPCLEVGYGSLGWLGELISWGVRETDLHGIELDPVRARQAREILPSADLRVGDAGKMPWADGSFRLVIASTVMTSILDPSVRRRVAEEISRVLAPGGSLLWYDFAVNNPRNPNVRRVRRRELHFLFPRLRGEVRSVTLAPPLARWIAPLSWVGATLLESMPLFRTHLLGVLVKDK
jgi:SAM-dependent methyltransferase